MDLRMFVKESILQVLGGVRDAQDVLDADTAPERQKGIAGHSFYSGRDQDHSVDQLVEFDVAIVAATSSAEGTSAKAGVGWLRIVEARMDGSTSEEAKEETASRLRFSVPIRMPGPGRV